MGDIADYSDQPRPQIVCDAVSAHDLVIDDLRRWYPVASSVGDAVAFIQGRKDFGLGKYGVVLHKDNGRDYPKDILDELGDLLAYLRVYLDKHPSLTSHYESSYLHLLRLMVRLFEDLPAFRELDSNG